MINCYKIILDCTQENSEFYKKVFLIYNYGQFKYFFYNIFIFSTKSWVKN